LKYKQPVYVQIFSQKNPSKFVEFRSHKGNFDVAERPEPIFHVTCCNL
jgi:hypothetical protein